MGPVEVGPRIEALSNDHAWGSRHLRQTEVTQFDVAVGIEEEILET